MRFPPLARRAREPGLRVDKKHLPQVAVIAIESISRQTREVDADLYSTRSSRVTDCFGCDNRSIVLSLDVRWKWFG